MKQIDGILKTFTKARTKLQQVIKTNGKLHVENEREIRVLGIENTLIVNEENRAIKIIDNINQFIGE